MVFTDKCNNDSMSGCYVLYIQVLFKIYCNVPKFSDRKVSANSADPDQTAPRGAV